MARGRRTEGLTTEYADGHGSNLDCRHPETKNQAEACLGGTNKERPYRHPEACEGSKDAAAAGHHAGILHFVQNDKQGVRQQCSEGSKRPFVTYGFRGSFAALRMTVSKFYPSMLIRAIRGQISKVFQRPLKLLGGDVVHFFEATGEMVGVGESHVTGGFLH
jgi:hypothetical protein